MQLIWSYKVSPGQCHVCGSGKSGKIIDTDRDELSRVRRYHVYLCEQCVTAAYKMLEPSQVLIEQVELSRLQGENTALTSEVLRLRSEAEEWDKRIAAIVKTEVDA